MNIGIVIKNFQNDFIDLIKNNHIAETKVSECNGYKMTLVMYYDYVKIQIEHLEKNDVYFPLIYCYVSKNTIDIHKENFFVNLIKEKINEVIEHFQTLLEEM